MTLLTLSTCSSTSSFVAVYAGASGTTTSFSAGLAPRFEERPPPPAVPPFSVICSVACAEPSINAATESIPKSLNKSAKYVRILPACSDKRCSIPSNSFSDVSCQSKFVSPSAIALQISTGTLNSRGISEIIALPNEASSSGKRAIILGHEFAMPSSNATTSCTAALRIMSTFSNNAVAAISTPSTMDGISSGKASVRP